MSYVLLIGSHSLAPIVAFIDRELTVTPAWWVGTLEAQDSDSLNYADTQEILSRVVASLASGQLASVQMRRDEPRMLVGLYQPHFCGARLALWTCVIEGSRDEVDGLYDRLKHLDGLCLVAVSLDEAPELASETVSIETFPWDAWQLVRARVCAPNGQWTERAGPGAA